MAQNKTKWNPGAATKALKAATKLAAMGIALLSTSVVAEPSQGLADTGTNFLHQDPTVFKPIDQCQKMEEMRAHHAHLGVLEDIFDPDPTKIDWTPGFIEKHVVSKDENDQPVIHFLVNW